MMPTENQIIGYRVKETGECTVGPMGRWRNGHLLDN